MKTSKLAHPATTLASVTIHQNQPARRTAIAAVFIAMHAMAISYCVTTAGEPYQAALEQSWRLGNSSNATNATITS